MKYLITGVLLLFFSSLGWADYQYELGIGQVDTDQETRFSDQLTIIGGPIPGLPSGSGFFNSINTVETQDLFLNGKFYFNPVSTAAIPKQEAGFLSQQSQVYLRLKQTDNDAVIRLNDSNGFQGRSNSKSDRGEFRLGFEWIGVNTPWILGLEHQNTDSKNRVPNGFPNLKSEEKRWQYTLGYYFSNSSRFSVSYSNIDVAVDQAVGTFTPGPSVVPILGPSNIQRITFDSDQLSANYKHLFPVFELQSIVLNLNLSRFSSDRSPDSEAYTIGLDYYPIHDLSVGISYSESNPEFGSKSHAQALSAKYFITDDVAASLALQSTDNSERRLINDGIVISASSRRFERDSLSLGVDVRF